jgi:hypothetical protein
LELAQLARTSRLGLGALRLRLGIPLTLFVYETELQQTNEMFSFFAPRRLMIIVINN